MLLFGEIGCLSKRTPLGRQHGIAPCFDVGQTGQSSESVRCSGALYEGRGHVDCPVQLSVCGRHFCSGKLVTFSFVHFYLLSMSSVSLYGIVCAGTADSIRHDDLDQDR